MFFFQRSGCGVATEQSCHSTSRFVVVVVVVVVVLIVVAAVVVVVAAVVVVGNGGQIMGSTCRLVHGYFSAVSGQTLYNRPPFLFGRPSGLLRDAPEWSSFHGDLVFLESHNPLYENNFQDVSPGPGHKMK